MKVLIDINSEITSQINTFDKVYTSGYKSDPQYEQLDLPSYFIETHKACRRINRSILDQYSSNACLSLIKLSDKLIYTQVRLILIAEKIKHTTKYSSVNIVTNDPKLFNYCVNALKIDLGNLVLTKKREKKTWSEKYWLRKLYYLIKSFKLLFNKPNLNKSSGYERLIFSYDSQQSIDNLVHYIDKKSIIYPLLSDSTKIKLLNQDGMKIIRKKFMIFSEIFSQLKNISTVRKELLATTLEPIIKSVLLRRLPDLAFQNALIQSVVSTSKSVHSVIGPFDAYAPIDFITENCNKKNIKTYCITHGVNYQYKVHYISPGTNYYTFWSQKHLDQFLRNCIIKNWNSYKITGHLGFSDFKERVPINSENKTLQKSILVIGEYFCKDNYYTSPFNANAVHQLFEILSAFSKKNQVLITIRTRISDEYYEIAENYMNDFILLSSPAKDLFEEIQNHDLVISVFSNALHEALIQRKKVLQVNLLGIENYRDLAKDNLVYYATTPEEIQKTIDNYMNNALPDLDFQTHEKEYCNNCKFEPVIITQ